MSGEEQTEVLVLHSAPHEDIYRFSAFLHAPTANSIPDDRIPSDALIVIHVGLLSFSQQLKSNPVSWGRSPNDQLAYSRHWIPDRWLDNPLAASVCLHHDASNCLSSMANNPRLCALRPSSDGLENSICSLWSHCHDYLALIPDFQRIDA